MDELAAAKRDPHVRRARGNRLEEHQITGSHIAGVDIPTDPILLLHLAGKCDSLLREYPLHEAAAIEPGQIAAAVPIGCSPERERQRHDRRWNPGWRVRPLAFGNGPWRNCGSRERPRRGDNGTLRGTAGSQQGQHHERCTPNPEHEPGTEHLELGTVGHHALIVVTLCVT